MPRGDATRDACFSAKEAAHRGEKSATDLLGGLLGDAASFEPLGLLRRSARTVVGVKETASPPADPQQPEARVAVAAMAMSSPE